jgi:hypothetical protein
MPLTDNITEINFSGKKFFIMLIPQLSHFPENESQVSFSDRQLSVCPYDVCLLDFYILPLGQF